MIAYLQFGNNEIGKYSRQYLVKEVKCHYFREYNEYRPVADAFCESIEIDVFIPGKQDVSLYDWFIDDNSLSGRILIEQNDPLTEENKNFTEIKFENGVCFEMAEKYEIDSTRRLLNIKFISTSVSVDGIDFSR